MTCVTRFAPSPTGYLHAGHAFAALFAARAGDRFLLRIEDIDRQRCRPHYEAALLEDLAWLGLTWEQPVRRQSDHWPDYARALDQLSARDLLYPCFCTRADIARAGGAPQGDLGPTYPGTCRNLSTSERRARRESEPYALRLDAETAWRMCQTKPLRWHDRAAGWQTVAREQIDDVVLARKDCPASYHLCVTHDDALQGITLVTRGEDLFAATPLHCLLQTLMGWDVPDYHHHPLVRDDRGQRLAKRDTPPTLRDLRLAGHMPDNLRIREN